MPVAMQTDREEAEHAGIHVESHPVRPADVLGLAVEPLNAQVSEAQPRDAADHGEQHALDEQLPDDPPPARTERDANRDFARPVGGARELQVGDVGAGDEQDEGDRAHQRPEHRLDLRADDEVEERRDLRGEVLVAVLVLIRQLRGDVLHLAAGLLERDAVGQAAVGHEGPPLARQPEYGRPLGHRHPDLALERPFEAVGHHADDRRGNRVDADRFADHRGIGRIARFPDAAADQRNRRRTLLVVVGDEASSELGLHADHVERVRRDEPSGIRLGERLVAADDHRAVLDERHVAAKGAARGAPILVVLERHAHAAASLVTGVDPHDPIGVVEREAPEEDGVDECEHGAVRADAQRQRDDGREGEPAVLDEPPGSETEILKQALHVSSPSWSLARWPTGAKVLDQTS